MAFSITFRAELKSKPVVFGVLKVGEGCFVEYEAHPEHSPSHHLRYGHLPRLEIATPGEDVHGPIELASINHSPLGNLLLFQVAEATPSPDKIGRGARQQGYTLAQVSRTPQRREVVYHPYLSLCPPSIFFRSSQLALRNRLAASLRSVLFPAIPPVAAQYYLPAISNYVLIKNNLSRIKVGRGQLAQRLAVGLACCCEFPVVISAAPIIGKTCCCVRARRVLLLVCWSPAVMRQGYL
ncbi:hypothetical protein GGS23DRAFT_460034 [Durotheca rogersii]|uniref:uncharacterized protein n=1 Tax=Durotheca rogersii TaxID=419775 RepID=UPI00221F4430|nr:uncharacterized protein GGS23DRAFT_460034 [Durotheca rogersii]KAI5864711.1 hypothetical protein GGS23DRAFT_460034 [Durotheca rogersii]